MANFLGPASENCPDGTNNNLGMSLSQNPCRLCPRTFKPTSIPANGPSGSPHYEKENDQDSNANAFLRPSPTRPTPPIARTRRKILAERTELGNDFDLDPAVGLDSSMETFDVDLSLPPYDPVTNYLSPRPRFLRYRPRPRIDAYLIRGIDHLELECSAEFENPSESEPESLNSEEEFKDCAVQDEEISLSPKDGVVVSGVNSMKTQSMKTSCVEEDEESTHLPKKDDGVSEPKLPVASQVSSMKTQLMVWSKSRSISALLILVLACLSLSSTDSPVISCHTTFNDLTLPNLFHVAKLAKANLDGFWSAYSASHMFQLISVLWEDVDFCTPVYGNLTASHEEICGFEKCEPLTQKRKGIELGPLKDLVHRSIDPHNPVSVQIGEESGSECGIVELQEELISVSAAPKTSGRGESYSEDGNGTNVRNKVIPESQVLKTSFKQESGSLRSDRIEIQNELIPISQAPPKMFSEEESWGLENRIEIQEELIPESLASEISSEQLSATGETITENGLAKIDLIQKAINPWTSDDAESEVADAFIIDGPREYLNLKNTALVIIWLVVAIIATAAMRLTNQVKVSSPSAAIPKLTKKSTGSPTTRERSCGSLSYGKKGLQGADEAGSRDGSRIIRRTSPPPSSALHFSTQPRSPQQQRRSRRRSVKPTWLRDFV